MEEAFSSKDRLKKKGTAMCDEVNECVGMVFEKGTQV
jgi:hypothetical protein